MKLETILVPTDFSRHSLAAVQYAVDLGQAYQADIVLVHAIEPVPRGLGRWREPTQLLERWQEEASARLDRLQRQIIKRYPRCRSEIHFGTIYEVIAKLVRKLPADLIIVATHGRTGLSHVVMGSVAEKIVRHASCPVLIVRAKFAAPRKRVQRTQSEERTNKAKRKSGRP